MLLLSIGSSSQITHPKVSPLSIVQQRIGLSTVQISYSRPAVRGRGVFGQQKDGQKGLVPNGRIWRVGANESTKITLDSDFEVLGHMLPKGTYAIYAFPKETDWQIAFHTNIEHWGDGREMYNADEDLFRITVKPQSTRYHQENLLISFDSITHSSANLNIVWASTKVVIPFFVDTQKRMESEIAKQLKEDATAQSYYEAARYLQEQHIDIVRALEYINTALSLGGDTYYYHRIKSLILADMGAFDKAVLSAKKSMAIAASLEKDEFVLMNQKNIIEWLKLQDKK